MPRTTKTMTLSLPPEMARQVEELTKEEGRTKSELFREALRRYIEERNWAKLYRYGEAKARLREIREKEIEDIVDSRRK
ncbi:MAG: ribbon-helix-helix domain-containing protein [Dehalococcoidia bacterium]|nr:ribbon-helix-helix domain-containing protein [Dehalococcoidia bacterium]